MKRQEDSISQSLKKFAEEQHRNFPPPSRMNIYSNNQIAGSKPYYGKVYPERYGPISNGSKAKN